MKNTQNVWFFLDDNFNSIIERTKMRRKTWQFNVIAPEYQIDFEEIRKDLSSSHPIALVELDGEKEWRGWVLIHDSILEKANLLAKEDDLFDMQYSASIVDILDPKEFTAWDTWVKLIKKAPWPEKERNKGVVKVTLKRV